MSTQINVEAFNAELDSLGEDEVQSYLDRRLWGNDVSKINLAHSWLRSKEELRRESRESEFIRLAKEANAIASDSSSKADKANRLAFTANMIAVIASAIAITSIIIQYINSAPS